MCSSVAKNTGCRLSKARKWLLVFAAGVVFAILCFIGLNAAMETVSSSNYCGSNCHEMNVSYQSWELSSHGSNHYGIRVECIDCHLPPQTEYFTHVSAKGYAGMKDLYKHHFGGDYDRERMRKHVLENISDEICLHCHDDLLSKVANPSARQAHLAVMYPPAGTEVSKCVECHENVGHERTKKIF